MDEKEKRRPKEFWKIYESLCRRQFVAPLSMVQKNSTENCLRFCCDSIQFANWSPILNALAAGLSLNEIYVYGRNWRQKIDESVNSEKKLDEYRRKLKKENNQRSIFYTNFLLRCFVDAVAVCSRDSVLLTTLNLHGIPLGSEKYLTILCTGLSSNRSIQSISLARCRIRDPGCELVIQSLLQNPSLRSIDFTSCVLTSKSACHIASFWKQRFSKLLQNDWQKPVNDKDTKQFEGIHCLILDKNRKFGDKGLALLCDILKNDFWLKSLSLRCCGLTRKSGETLIDLLETNSTLVSMDFGENKLSADILKITRRLLKRRLEKGERIALKRRLIDPKKDLRRCGRSTGRTRKKRWKKCNASSEKSVATIGLGNRSDVARLKERLSSLIDCNRQLKNSLADNQRLFLNEQFLRRNAEKRCESMVPLVEKLGNGCQEQHKKRSRILLETHLCTGIREIFRDLEIMAIEAKIEKIDDRSQKPIDANVQNYTNKSEVKSKKMYTVQKRPHCPPRQRP